MNACLADVAYRCALCHDQRRLFSSTLKRMIRCPGCNRTPRNDPSGLRAISQTEAERHQAFRDREAIKRARELAGALQFCERGASRARKLDPKRAPVDRIMQRWAVGEGSGLPHTSEELDLLALEAAEHADTFTVHPASSPPLDDDTQIIIDRTVLHAPRTPWDMRQLIRQWYLAPKPVYLVAEDCGISRSSIYRRWHDTLDHLREKFEGAGNATLLRLVNTLG